MVAGARFNPLPGLEDQAGKPHLLQIRSGSTSNSLPAGSPFASWDTACDINDSLLAAFIQLLSLEDEVEVDCVLAPGYRLPQEICLNLPSKQTDVTAESVKVLYDSFAHGKAATAIQVLPTCSSCLRQASCPPARPVNIKRPVTLSLTLYICFAPLRTCARDLTSWPAPRQ